MSISSDKKRSPKCYDPPTIVGQHFNNALTEHSTTLLVTEYLSSGEIGHGYSISLAKQQKKIDVALQLSE